MKQERVSEAIARISAEKAAKINLVVHGSVTFVVQDGKVLRHEIRISELNREGA